MKLSFLYVMGIMTLGCNSPGRSKPNEKKPLTIVKLPNLSWRDSSKTDTGFRIATVDYYLVKCEGFDSDEIRSGIDRYTKNIQATMPCPYAQCNMLYFKETSETNAKNLNADKDLIDTYSTKHDLIFEYVWNYSELLGIYQYSNGLIINPKATIIIKNVPNSTH